MGLSAEREREIYNTEDITHINSIWQHYPPFHTCSRALYYFLMSSSSSFSACRFLEVAAEVADSDDHGVVDLLSPDTKISPDGVSGDRNIMQKLEYFISVMSEVTANRKLNRNINKPYCFMAYKRWKACLSSKLLSPYFVPYLYMASCPMAYMQIQWRKPKKWLPMLYEYIIHI